MVKNQSNLQLSAKKVNSIVTQSPFVRRLRNRNIPLAPKVAARGQQRKLAVITSTPQTECKSHSANDASMPSVILSADDDLSIESHRSTLPKAKRGLSTCFNDVATTNESNADAEMQCIAEEIEDNELSKEISALKLSRIDSVAIVDDGVSHCVTVSDEIDLKSLAHSDAGHIDSANEGDIEISMLADGTQSKVEPQENTNEAEHSASQCAQSITDEQPSQKSIQPEDLAEAEASSSSAQPKPTETVRTRRNIGFNDSLSIHEVSRGNTTNKTDRTLLRFSIPAGKWRRSIFQLRKNILTRAYSFAPFECLSLSSLIAYIF